MACTGGFNGIRLCTGLLSYKGGGGDATMGAGTLAGSGGDDGCKGSTLGSAGVMSTVGGGDDMGGEVIGTLGSLAVGVGGAAFLL